MSYLDEYFSRGGSSSSYLDDYFGSPEPTPEPEGPQPVRAPEQELRPEDEDDWAFTRGLKSIAPQYGVQGHYTNAMHEMLRDNPDMANFHHYKASEHEARLQALQQGIPSEFFGDVVSRDETGDIDFNWSNLPGWAGYTAGSMIGDLALGLGAGALGAKAVRTLGQDALKEKFADEMGQRLGEGLTAEAAEKVAQTAAQNLAAKQATGGAAAGAFASGVPQLTSETYGKDYRADGEASIPHAIVGGLGAAALDAYLPTEILKKLGTGRVRSPADLPTAPGEDAPGYLSRLLSEGTELILKGGASEAGQEVVTGMAAGVGTSAKELGNAFMAGGLMGGMVAPVTAAGAQPLAIDPDQLARQLVAEQGGDFLDQTKAAAAATAGFTGQANARLDGAYQPPEVSATYTPPETQGPSGLQGADTFTDAAAVDMPGTPLQPQGTPLPTGGIYDAEPEGMFGDTRELRRAQQQVQQQSGPDSTIEMAPEPQAPKLLPRTPASDQAKSPVEPTGDQVGEAQVPEQTAFEAQQERRLADNASERDQILTKISELQQDYDERQKRLSSGRNHLGHKIPAQNRMLMEKRQERIKGEIEELRAKLPAVEESRQQIPRDNRLMFSRGAYAPADYGEPRIGLKNPPQETQSTPKGYGYETDYDKNKTDNVTSSIPTPQQAQERDQVIKVARAFQRAFGGLEDVSMELSEGASSMADPNAPGSFASAAVDIGGKRVRLDMEGLRQEAKETGQNVNALAWNKLRHEVVSHLGIRGLLGDQFEPSMRRALGIKSFSEIQKNVEDTYADQALDRALEADRAGVSKLLGEETMQALTSGKISDQQLLEAGQKVLQAARTGRLNQNARDQIDQFIGDEVVAAVSEGKPGESGSWSRLTSAIKRGLRKRGLYNKGMTEDEVHNLIRASAKRLRKGGSVGEAKGGRRFARSLSDDMKSLSVVPYLDEDKPIPVEEIAGEGGKVTIPKLARWLSEKAQRVAADRGIDLSQDTPEVADFISDVLAYEIEAARSRPGSAENWYRENLQEALTIVADKHPEVATDDNARSAFQVALAITSNGQAVEENAALAEQVYRQFKDTGRMPVFGSGPSANQMESGFEIYNTLLDELGPDLTTRFLDSRLTVGELKAMGFEPSGELVSADLPVAAIFGPKVGGGFYPNLRGDFSPVTMDRWFMRSIGRLRGNLFSPRSEEEIAAKKARFRAALPAAKRTLDDDALMDEAYKTFRAYANDSYSDRSEVNRAAKLLVEATEGLHQAPASGSERAFLRDVMKRTADKLKLEGAELENATMQALLWYPEKDFYKAAGVRGKSESTDYASEFRKLLGEPSSESEARVLAEPAGALEGRELRDLVARRTLRGLRERTDPAGTGDHGDDSGHYARASKADRKFHLAGKRGRVLRLYRPQLKTRNALATLGRDAPPFRELDPETGAEVFHEAITAAKQNNAYGAAVYVYPMEDYKGMRLFLSPDSSVGFAIKGDDFVSFFNTGTGEYKGVASAAALLAIKNGARRLDAFDTELGKFYSQVGFREVARLPWDDSEAPSGWDKDTFAAYNNGEPDVLFMVYDPNYAPAQYQPENKTVKDYAAAVRAQNRAVRTIRQDERRQGRFYSRNLKRPAPEQATNLALAREDLKQIGSMKEAYRTIKPPVYQTDLQDIVATIDPEAKFVSDWYQEGRHGPVPPSAVMDIRLSRPKQLDRIADDPDLDDEAKMIAGMDTATEFTLYHTEDDEVFVDTSMMTAGASAGYRAYAIAGAYAHNNNLKFIGDPRSVSSIARLRRNEHYLSLALKYGKTNFLKPSIEQLDPVTHASSDADERLTPVEWTDDDDQNIDNLLWANYNNVREFIPEIDEIDYADGQFYNRDGSPVTSDQLRDLAGRGSRRHENNLPGEVDPQSAPLAGILFGSASIKRAAFVGARLRGAIPEGRGSHVSPDGELAPTWVNTLYSRKITKGRDPELADAAYAVQQGKMSAADYETLLTARNPVTPFKTVPDPASVEEAKNAVGPKKAETFGLAEKVLKEGDTADIRLDIPAFDNHGIWVPTVHFKHNGKNTSAYTTVTRATDVQFKTNDKKALQIAAGGNKGPFAVIRGKWKPTTPAAAKMAAAKAMKDSDWVQVGFNPVKHAYYFDRESTQPVLSADEIIQVGPLVMAKNPVFGKKEDFLFGRRLASKNKLGLYSGVEQAVLEMRLPEFKKPGGKASGKQIWQKLRNMPGVKQEELHWTGIEEYLTGADEKLTREQVAEFIHNNGVKVEEIEASQSVAQPEDAVSMTALANDRGDEVANEYLDYLARDGFRVTDETRRRLRDVSTNMLSPDYDRTMEQARNEVREEANTDFEVYSIANDDRYVVGNPDVGYSVFDPELGRPSIGPVGSFNELRVQMRGMFEAELDDSSRHAGGTVPRWEGYVTDGDYENYRELKLTLPNNPGDDFVADGHFDDPNIVAFLRVTDRDDGQTFFVDEFQSDWHQAGRQEGYEGAPETEAKKRAYDTAWQKYMDFTNGVQNLQIEIGETVNQLEAELGGLVWDIAQELDSDLRQQDIFPDIPRRLTRTPMQRRLSEEQRQILQAAETRMPDDLRRRVDDLQRMRNKHNDMLRNAPTRPTPPHPVPDAPFKKDAWINLGIKRALVKAVEEGKTKFAWADSNVLADRWSDEYIELYRNLSDRKMVKMVKKLTGQTPRRLPLVDTPGLSLEQFREKLRRDDHFAHGTQFSLRGRNSVWWTDQDGTEGGTLEQAWEALQDLERTRPPGKWEIDIPPELASEIKEEGFSLFSRRLPPRIAAIGREVQGTAWSDMTTTEKVKQLQRDWKNRDSRKWKQAAFDSFYSIKALEQTTNNGELRDAADSAYKMAISTRGTQGMLATVMAKSMIEYDGKGFRMKKGSKSFLQVFEPIKAMGPETVYTWELWAAAKRAQRLLNEGREQNWDQAKIDEINQYVKNAGLEAVFDAVHRDWLTLNEQVLDLGVATGLLTQEKADEYKATKDYVPFFRSLEDEETATVGPVQKFSLVGQSFGDRRLKGSDAKTGAMLENMVMGITRAIDAGVKNVAAQRTIDAALGLGDMVAERVPGRGPQFLARDMVEIKRNGEREVYQVKDELLLKSLGALGPEIVPNWIRLMGYPKRWLTTGVTASPAFMLANYVRDTLSTLVTVHKKHVPVLDSLRGAMQEIKQSDEVWSIMASGNAWSDQYATDPSDVRRQIKQLQGDTYIDGPAKAWQMWQRLGRVFEQANRLGVREATLRDGGASEYEANYQAQDVLNFSMRGDSQFMLAMAYWLPFFNARVQGLYRLARGAKEDWRAFTVKGGTLAIASAALATLYDDDEDYERLPDWDKDLHWHIFGPKTENPADRLHYRIPKPFEVGLIFGTLTERATRALMGNEEWSDFGGALFRGVRDTLAINPIPQIARPALEMSVNKNFFLDRPIRSPWVEEPKAQFNERTTELSIQVGKHMPDWAPDWMQSPQMLDHAIRGYFGSIGIFAAEMASEAMKVNMDLPKEPEKRISDYPVLRRFTQTGQQRSKYVGDFYELEREASGLYSQIKNFRDEGRLDDVAELQESGAEKLEARLPLGRIRRRLSKINKQIRAIRVSRDLTPADKRARIDELVAAKNELAQAAVEQWGDRF